MKKKIIAGLAIASVAVLLVAIRAQAGARWADGLSPRETEDHVAKHAYKVFGGSTTATSGTIVFKGHADSLSLLSMGGTCSFTVDSSSDVGSANTRHEIPSNQSVTENYAVPLSSPLVVNYFLQNGATLYFDGGGYVIRPEEVH